MISLDPEVQTHTGSRGAWEFTAITPTAALPPGGCLYNVHVFGANGVCFATLQYFAGQTLFPGSLSVEIVPKAIKVTRFCSIGSKRLKPYCDLLILLIIFKYSFRGYISHILAFLYSIASQIRDLFLR